MADPQVAAVTSRLQALYRAGHATGRGPRKSGHPADCAGCAATRALADAYDAYWSVHRSGDKYRA